MDVNVSRRSLKVKIEPNLKQKQIIDQTLGNTRFFWNYCLNHKNQFYESIKNLTKEEQKLKWKEYKNPSYKELSKEINWLAENIPCEALINKQRDLYQAYSNFFSSISGKRKGRKINPPKFKKKSDRKDSFACYMISDYCFDWHHRTIKIPKCGKVKFKHAEDKKGNWIDWFLNAKPKHLTVSKDKIGNYYCSILFEKEEEIPSIILSGDESQVIGLDFSPSKMYVDSNNNTGIDFGYYPFKQKNLKKLRKQQRRLKRKKKGSSNYEKQRIKVAKVEKYIADCRRDFQEKESLRLVRNYEVICIEDLNLQGISKFLPNAKNVQDASWYNFTQLLERKSANNNCVVIKAERYYPSSKTCNLCGCVNKNLKLSDRTFECPECGFSIDRDLNAAFNLKNYAINEIAKYLPLEQGKVRPVEDMEGDVSEKDLSGVPNFEAGIFESDFK